MGTFTTLFMLATYGLSASSTVQQGGEQGIYHGNSIQTFERGLSTYVRGEMQKSILTPGDTVEWKVKLKAGQIIVGEATSEVLDPAAQVVDDKGAVVAKNDDRYPGDQRPLLFWRCDKDGDYKFQILSYQNKSGGQVFARFSTYNTIDVPSDAMVEGVVDATQPFMVRVPMKAGQIKDFVAEKRGEANYINFNFGTVINPYGLPERGPSLGESLSPAIRALVAPLDGDYYILASPYGYRGGDGRVRIGTRTFEPVKLEKTGNTVTAKAPTNRPVVWELSVKAGELLEVSTPDLSLGSQFSLGEAPDFSQFDTAKPETNPFFPVLRTQRLGAESAIDILPGRARDGRVTVFRARRDAKLWLASNAVGAANKEFSLQVKPAASEYAEQRANSSKLRVGNTDYWAFEAKAGDVMTFKSTANGFAQKIFVLDPDLTEIRSATAEPDQTTDDWRMIVQKPGRYLVAMSCLGDGGAGDYTLTRQVFHAKEFNRTSPAKAEISNGQIQIWKFTATPEEPLLVRWNSSNWSYDVAIYDEQGHPVDFQRQSMDENNKFGLLKVDKPQTFVIVLTGHQDKANYTIELGNIPGYKPVSGKGSSGSY